MGIYSTIVNFFQEGGVFMYPIVIVFALGLAIALERWLYLTMTTVKNMSALAEPPAVGTIPLESGDRLTRAEFERRYEAMPHLKKAELIEGVVYVPSPIRLGLHSRPHLHMAGWLATYEARTPGRGVPEWEPE